MFILNEISQNIQIPAAGQYESYQAHLQRVISYAGISQKKLNEIKQRFTETDQLNNADLDWFDKKEPRRVNWAWMFLYLYSSPLGVNQPECGVHPYEGKLGIVINHQNYRHEYPVIRINHSCFKDTHNTVGRIEQIKAAFRTGEVCKQGQLEIVELVKQLWPEIYENKAFAGWLNQKNQEQVDWAWEYMQEAAKKVYPKIPTHWTPASDIERYWALLAMYDLIEENDTKELHSFKIKRAWSQKKYRDKQGDKKPYSIGMTAKTKQQLDELTEHYDTKITNLIERLIKDAHKQLKVKGDASETQNGE
ncbi:hypothetical protein [Shewanella algae]|uniref:hypothetical protein n=1 Tax=Shewanella algae TaxID=38313 RepID=UPI001AAF143E|nr:hypothetical protein [Shewanella algae]MBO2694654.1 hypothetical protein [Shewanella algae]